MEQKRIPKIVQAKSSNPILRDFAEPVQLEEIKNDKIQKIIKDMKNSLSKEEEAETATEKGAGARA